MNQNFIAKVPLKSEEESFFISPYYEKSYEFPYNPDPLCSANNYDIYDEMRADDQIKAVLSLKKSLIIGSGYQIECKDDEVKEILETNLKDIGKMGIQPTFDEILFDMLSCYDYGFSLSEPLYELIGGKYSLKTIKTRPPHTFKFEIDKKGNVLQIKQSTDTGEIALEPDKFIHIAYQREHGNPYGKSDLFNAYTAWKMKKFFIKMFAKYAERFGTPTIHGKFDDNTHKDDINEFYTILKSIQNNTVIATPKSSEVEFLFQGKEAADLYDRSIEKFNLWMSRAILVPDLLGYTGSQTEGGSYALGEKQFNLFMSTLRKDRMILENKINTKVLMPLLDANWNGIPASFKFLPYSEKDEFELTKIWLEAIKTTTYRPSAEEINHFRTIIKYPVQPKEEVQIGQPQPKTPFQPFKEFREKSSYEKKIDFKEVERILDKNEGNLKRLLLKSATRIVKGLIEQIKDKNIITNWKIEAINDLKIRYLKEMNFVLRNSFKDLFLDSINQAEKEIFPQALGKYVDREILPEEYLDIIEQESFKVVGDYSNEILKLCKNRLMNAAKTGIAQNKVVDDIMEHTMQFNEKWVNTIVRTKTTEVYNAARKIYWETDELAKQIVVAFEFSAILDERTSDVCQSLDGKIFEKGDFIDKVTPPLHFNCRSLLVPVTKFEDYVANKPIDLDVLRKKGGGLI